MRVAGTSWTAGSQRSRESMASGTLSSIGIFLESRSVQLGAGGLYSGAGGVELLPDGRVGRASALCSNPVIYLVNPL